MSTWKLSSFNVLVSQGVYQNEGKGEIYKDERNHNDIIRWHPKSGYISSDGTIRQSPANGLIHELGHTYYELHDPDGANKELNEITLIDDEEESTKRLNEYNEKYEISKYKEASDRWIIQNIEDKFGEDKRKTHAGYNLKTKGVFSVEGGTCSTSKGKKMKVKDLKTQ